MNTDRTPQYIKLDERNHVEKPLLDQLDGLDWEIIDLDNKQHPGDTFRANLARSPVARGRAIRARGRAIVRD